MTLRVEDQEEKEKCNADRINTLEEDIINLRKVDVKHNEMRNIQEGYSRRSNIRGVGFPAKENENCVEIARSVMDKVGVPKVNV